MLSKILEKVREAEWNSQYELAIKRMYELCDANSNSLSNEQERHLLNELIGFYENLNQIGELSAKQLQVHKILITERNNKIYKSL
jgi:hypothetical protein